jgi:hypothetical protein
MAPSRFSATGSRRSRLPPDPPLPGIDPRSTGRERGISRSVFCSWHKGIKAETRSEFRRYGDLRIVKADDAALIRPAFCRKNTRLSVPFHSTRRRYRGRKPKEERLIDLRRRFRRVSERVGLAALSPGYKWAFRLLLVVLALEAGLLTMMTVSPWPLGVTLRHLGAMRNCDAARAMGLAPARRSEPGYWAKHDADNDGVACEPWPRR